MAISYLSGGRIQGLSSDTKPTNVPLQSLFEETDTGKFFTLLYATGFASASWIEMGTGGVITQNTALNSTLVSGGNGSSGGHGTYNIQYSVETFSGGAWTAGGLMTIARTLHIGGGTSTNAFVSAGENWSGGGYASPYTVTTEEYNGSSWGAGGDYPYPVWYASGAGSQTNGIAGSGNKTGGSNLTDSKKYNGTAWSATGALAHGAYGGAMGGNGTDAVFTGGNVGSKNATDEFNGSSWSSGGTLVTGRYIHGGDGNSTNAIVYSGDAQTVETYNGSSWTGVGNASGGAVRSGAFVGGNATQAICGFGIQSGTRVQTTEIWDGTSFSASGTSTVGRQYPNGGSAS